jgi:hypothetical protein
MDEGGLGEKRKSYYKAQSPGFSSMSTEAKTSAGSGKMLNGIFYND